MSDGVASCFRCKRCGRPITSHEYWDYCSWYCNDVAQKELMQYRIDVYEKKKCEAAESRDVEHE